MRHSRLATALLATLLGACATAPPVAREALQAEVSATERAFAQTMADRDYTAFTRFLSEDAIFISGAAPLRGKAAVAAAWKRFYDAPAAPFSWLPEQVDVLDSGRLAWSSGPVFDAGGKRIATFNSVWLREGDGVWRIVFDKGSDTCP